MGIRGPDVILKEMGEMANTLDDLYHNKRAFYGDRNPDVQKYRILSRAARDIYDKSVIRFNDDTPQGVVFTPEEKFRLELKLNTVANIMQTARGTGRHYGSSDDTKAMDDFKYESDARANQWTVGSLKEEALAVQQFMKERGYEPTSQMKDVFGKVGSSASMDTRVMKVACEFLIEQAVVSYDMEDFVKSHSTGYANAVAKSEDGVVVPEILAHNGEAPDSKLRTTWGDAVAITGKNEWNNLKGYHDDERRLVRNFHHDGAGGNVYSLDGDVVLSIPHHSTLVSADIDEKSARFVSYSTLEDRENASVLSSGDQTGIFHVQIIAHNGGAQIELSDDRTVPRFSMHDGTDDGLTGLDIGKDGHFAAVRRERYGEPYEVREYAFFRDEQGQLYPVDPTSGRLFEENGMPSKEALIAQSEKLYGGALNMNSRAAQILFGDAAKGLSDAEMIYSGGKGLSFPDYKDVTHRFSFDKRPEFSGCTYSKSPTTGAAVISAESGGSVIDSGKVDDPRNGGQLDSITVHYEGGIYQRIIGKGMEGYTGLDKELNDHDGPRVEEGTPLALMDEDTPYVRVQTMVHYGGKFYALDPSYIDELRKGAESRGYEPDDNDIKFLQQLNDWDDDTVEVNGQTVDKFNVNTMMRNALKEDNPRAAAVAYDQLPEALQDKVEPYEVAQSPVTTSEEFIAASDPVSADVLDGETVRAPLPIPSAPLPTQSLTA